jgi:putative ABC transport system permease protein
MIEIKEIISIIPFWGLVILWSIFFIKKESVISRRILWSSFRTTVQLIVLAFALELIFKSSFFGMSLLVALIMTMNSSMQLSFKSRSRKLKVFWISFFSQVLSIWPLAYYFSLDENPLDFQSPKAILPLLGMLLGNSLNGISIASESYHENMNDKQDEVMSLMALGANPKEATHRIFYSSLLKGITPQLNSMLAMGIVSIPGMMAGQLISKSNAFEASLTQIKMMLSILVGTITCIVIMMTILRKTYFTSRGELCLK